MKKSKGWVLTLSAILVLAGCDKNTEELTPNSREIRFGAETMYQNDVRTRTEYSGVDENGGTMTSTSQFERIDWVAGMDRVRILCKEAVDEEGKPLSNPAADLQIGSPSADGEKSIASTKLVKGEPMYWGTGEHSFFALYPAPGTKSNLNEAWAVTESDATIELAGGKATVIGAIPADQPVVKKETAYKPNMNFAYMYAAKKQAQSSDAVTLDFKPLVTAVEFSLKALDDRMAESTLKTLTLSSTSSSLAGSFTAELDAATGTAVPTIGTTAASAVTLTFPEGTKLSKDEYITATVLMLPFDQKDLTLELGFDSGMTRKLVLKSNGSPISISACKKAYVKIGVPADMTSVFEVTPEINFSYEGATLEGAVKSTLTAFKEALSWEIEGYYSDKEATKKLEEMPAWMTSFNEGNPGGNGTTDASEEAVKIVVPQQVPNVTESFTDEAKRLNNLIGEGPVGSESSYKNLSNPSNMDSDVIKESANCYVVNALGYYKIPLVMGNGVKNGELNPDETTYKGFAGNNTDDLRVLFVDYKGNPIQNPYLHKSSSGVGTPTSAYIIWEDTDGLIEASESYDLPEGSIVKNGDCYWLKFHVAVRRQGNATIAIQDQNGEVMWSYHIWVSDFVPKSASADVTFTNNIKYTAHYVNGEEISANKDIQMALMTRYVGQVVYGRTVTTNYPANTVYVKFKQDVTGKEAIMKVTQDEKTEEVKYEDGYPTYQWGRKDAMWPNNGATSGVWYGKAPEYTDDEKTGLRGPVSQKEAILNPDKYIWGYVTNNEAGDPHFHTLAIDKTYPFYYKGNDLSNKYPYWKNYTTDVKSFPVNYWSATSSMPTDNTWIYLAYWGNENPQAVISKEMTFPKKTIYDPNPAGYVMSASYFLDYLVRGINKRTYEEPSAEEGNAYFEVVLGSNLFKSKSGNRIVYYTSPEKNNTYSFDSNRYYRNEKDIFKNDGMVFLSGDPRIANDGAYPYPYPAGSGYCFGQGEDNSSFIFFSKGMAFGSIPVREDIVPDPILFPSGHNFKNIKEWFDEINGSSSGTPAVGHEPYSTHKENPAF